MVTTHGYRAQPQRLVDRVPALFWFLGVYCQVMRISGKMSRG